MIATFKVGSIVKIKTGAYPMYESLPSRFNPRVATTGIVRYVSRHGWLQVSVTDKNKKHLFNECFWPDDLKKVKCECKIFKKAQISNNAS